MATFSITSSTGDGYIDKTDASWSTARGATTGDSVSASASNPRCPEAGKPSDYLIRRAFFWFDVSSIPTSATITSATVRFVFDDGELIDDDNASTNLVDSTASTTLTTADYNNSGTTLQSDDTADLTDIGTNAPWTFTFTLNSTGIATVQAAVGGTVKFALINSRDRLNQTPTGRNQHNTSMSDNGTEANKPLLTISYTTPDDNYGFFLA